MHKEAILHYYASELEKERLDLDLFKLEGVRTKRVISRYIGHTSQNVVDIGGGAGYYAFWLQRQGHQVTLVDLSPTNIVLAEDYAKANDLSLTDIMRGDATSLELKSSTYSFALMSGPLYHLQDRSARIQALQEAYRVLEPGGTFLCTVCSRYAMLFFGLKYGHVFDPEFEEILNTGLQTGLHENDSANPEYWTTAYLHTPQEIQEEIEEAGFNFGKLHAVEGPGWVVAEGLDKEENSSRNETLHRVLDHVESNKDLLPFSRNIIATATKPNV